MDLANKQRPNNLDEFVGQKHFISKNKALYKLIKKKDIPHLFFYGKPGTGKTSLAKIIAKEIQTSYYYFNATSIKIEDLRKIFEKHKNSLIKPLIFIDEVHRLSKIQQEVLLPIMENYSAIIIGASTENPFFFLSDAIRSRAFLYEFKALDYGEMNTILEKTLKAENIQLEKEAKQYLINSSDARAMLNLLNFSLKVSNKIDIKLLKELRPNNMSIDISSKDTHYDLASALIKSMRGSDVNASLYYLACLIKGSENIDFITRRLVIFASEDIGNANPNALNLANSTMLTANKIGYPEARIILAQCVIYLASCPKSNSSYKAINNALDYLENNSNFNIPKHLKANNKEYQNPHNFGVYMEQKYLEKELKLYTSQNIAFEKTLNDWLKKIKNKDK